MPIDPASTEASSVRMSPNMFSVTITSNLAGLGDQAHRGRIDQQVVQADLRVARARPARLPAATGARIPARWPYRPAVSFLAPGLGQAEGQVDHALDLVIKIFQRVYRALRAVDRAAALWAGQNTARRSARG